MTILGFVGEMIYNEVSFYACFYFSPIKHHSNLYSCTLKNNAPQRSAGNVSSKLLKGVSYIGKRGIIIETAQIRDELKVSNNQ